MQNIVLLIAFFCCVIFWSLIVFFLVPGCVPLLLLFPGLFRMIHLKS